MDKIIKWKQQCDANEIVKILKIKYYDAYYCETLMDAREKVLELIPKSSSIALGSSVTLNQMDIIDEFRNCDYNLFDRYKDVPFSEAVEIMCESMLSDFLVASTNAITKNGQLVNLDSTGNRAAGMIFNPRKVIVVVKINKIVEDLDKLFKRLKKIEILNTKRINHKATRTTTGTCSDCDVKCRIFNYMSVVNNVKKFTNRFTILVIADNVGY